MKSTVQIRFNYHDHDFFVKFCHKSRWPQCADHDIIPENLAVTIYYSSVVRCRFPNVSFYEKLFCYFSFGICSESESIIIIRNQFILHVYYIINASFNHLIFQSKKLTSKAVHIRIFISLLHDAFFCKAKKLMEPV